MRKFNLDDTMRDVTADYSIILSKQTFAGLESYAGRLNSGTEAAGQYVKNLALLEWTGDVIFAFAK